MTYFLATEEFMKMVNMIQTIISKHSDNSEELTNFSKTASDTKTTWHRINSLLFPNHSNSQLELELNFYVIAGSSSIASKFYTHFAEVAPSLSANIP